MKNELIKNRITSKRHENDQRESKIFKTEKKSGCSMLKNNDQGLVPKWNDFVFSYSTKVFVMI